MPNAPTPTIYFDRPKKERLRKAYDVAIAAGQDQFNFEGSEFVTKYAEYLLQYLDMQLPDA